MVSRVRAGIHGGVEVKKSGSSIEPLLLAGIHTGFLLLVELAVRERDRSGAGSREDRPVGEHRKGLDLVGHARDR